MTVQGKPRIGIEFDLGGLADLHLGQIGFLEIRLDIALTAGDNSHHWQPADQLLASKQAISLRNAPGHRRPDDCPCKVEFGCSPLRLRGSYSWQHAGNLRPGSKLGPRLGLLCLIESQLFPRLRNLMLGRLVRCFGCEAADPQSALALKVGLSKPDVLTRGGNICT